MKKEALKWVFTVIGVVFLGYIILVGGRSLHPEVRWQKLKVVDGRWHFSDFPSCSVKPLDPHWKPAHASRNRVGVAYFAWREGGGIIEVTSSDMDSDALLADCLEGKQDNTGLPLFGSLTGPIERTPAILAATNTIDNSKHVTCKGEFSFSKGRLKGKKAMVYETSVAVPARGTTFLFQLQVRWDGPTIVEKLQNETEDQKQARRLRLENEFLQFVLSFREDD